MSFLLPESPAESYTCVSIEIPNTQQDVRNFLGQLLMLSQWFQYERTGNDLGKQVADTWSITLENVRIGACMEERQDPESPCILQVSNGSGETWEQFADITECVDSSYIQNLIADSPELQRAIASVSNVAYQTIYTGENPDILAMSWLAGQTNCDNDKLYGVTLQLARWLNVIAVDLLEIFVSAFNQGGRLGDLIEAIPLVGEMPLDDLFQFMEEVATDIKQAYEAAYDSQIEEDISCELFCIAVDECDITLEQARDYMKSKLVHAVTDTNFLVIINDIIANNWVGEQAIYVMNWFILDALILGTEILGIDANRAVKTVATFFNDPNPDWATLCDCQPVEQAFYLEVDLTAGDGDCYASAGNGVWVNGVGWQGEDVSGSQTNLFLFFDFLSPIQVTQLEWRGARTPSAGNGVAYCRYYVGSTGYIDNTITGVSRPYPYIKGYDRPTSGTTRVNWGCNSSGGTTDIYYDRLRMTIIATEIPQELIDGGGVEYVP